VPEQQRVSVLLPSSSWPGEVGQRVEEEEAKGLRLRKVRNEQGVTRLVFTAVTPEDEGIITLVAAESALPHGAEAGLGHWGRNIDVFATSVFRSVYLVFFGKYEEREPHNFDREREWSYRIEYRSPSSPKQHFDGWNLLNSRTCNLPTFDLSVGATDGSRVTFDVYKSATELQPERTQADFDEWQNFACSSPASWVEPLRRSARWRRALRSVLQGVGQLTGTSRRRDEYLRDIYRRKSE